MKMKIAAVSLTAALVLSSCARNDGEETESVTVSLTVETSAVTEEPVVTEDVFLADYTEQTTTETTAEEKEIAVIFGKEYFAENWDVVLDADITTEITEEDINGINTLRELHGGNLSFSVINCKGHDLSFLSGLDGFGVMSFYGIEDGDLSFVTTLNGVKTVSLNDLILDPEALAEQINKTDIDSISIRAENFCSLDMDALIRLMPQCDIYYTSPSGTEDFENNRFYFYEAPTEGFLVRSAPYVAHSSTKKIDREMSDTVTFYFDNRTDKDIAVQKAELYLEKGDRKVPIYFADGETSLETDITVETAQTAEFKITADMLDYSTLEDGIYTAVLYYGEETAETSLYICKEMCGDPDFLDEEQSEVFSKAKEYIFGNFFSFNMTEEYASEHTPEEFAETFSDALEYNYALKLVNEHYTDENGDLKAYSADRPGNLTHIGYCYEPVYLSDSEAAFKKIITCCDYYENPYFVWFVEVNYHMVKTENGWRMDRFMTW
ncbi:MAG: hypothetical protein ACI4J6_10985 [Oscillospiraceae bacterium]